MNTPTKVVIEITAKRHVTRVFAGEKLLKERGWTRTDYGSKAEARGDFHDDFPREHAFAEALEDADPHDIMCELGKRAED